MLFMKSAAPATTGWMTDEDGYRILYVNGIALKAIPPKDRTYGPNY